MISPLLGALEEVLQQQLKHQHECLVKIILQLDIKYSFQETFLPLIHLLERKSM